MTKFKMGGTSSKTFSFGPQGAQPGASVSGTILAVEEKQSTDYDSKKPEFWPNGDPKMYTAITLATDLRDPANPHDTGEREVRIDGRRRLNDNGTKSKMCAVLDAIRAATGSDEVEYGGRLTVAWVSGMGFSGDPRNYEATYQPPAMDLGGQPPAQQQAQPQQVQQQPPVQQYAQTPQGQVNTATGELAPAQPQQAPAQQPVQQVPPQPAAGPEQPTQEQVAALRAAGLDPSTVWPHYQAS